MSLATLLVFATILSSPSVKISGIPDSLHLQSGQGRAEVSADTLVVSAGPKTDFYVPSDGGAAALTAPLVLFPASGDFVFSGRVTLDLKTDFDGAALIVYADATHWAKLLVEQSRADLRGATSSVVDGTGDDAYHGQLAPGQASLFLKVTRVGNTYVFYTSPDGKAWQVARSFLLPGGLATSLGFEAQSPLGQGFDARFDQLRFEQRTPKDYWQGE